MYQKILIILLIIIFLYLLNKSIKINEHFVSEEDAITDYNSYFDINSIITDNNGKWTTISSSVNTDNSISNYITINITSLVSGTITVPNITNDNIFDGTVYYIFYVSQNLIKGQNGSKQISITSCFDLCPKTVLDLQTRVVSIIVGNNNLKFMSVNINDRTLLTQTDLDNIKNYNFPSTEYNLFNITAYDTTNYYAILYDYVFADNLVKFNNNTNSKVNVDISTKLVNRLYISVSRYFKDVTSNIIYTKISPPVLYNIVNNILPDSITVASQNSDRDKNTINFNAFTYYGTNIFIWIPTIDINYSIPSKINSLIDTSNLIFAQTNSYPMLTSTTKSTTYSYRPYLYSTIDTTDINKTFTFYVNSLPNV
jgi:hypothetical protein